MSAVGAEPPNDRKTRRLLRPPGAAILIGDDTFQQGSQLILLYARQLIYTRVWGVRCERVKFADSAVVGQLSCRVFVLGCALSELEFRIYLGYIF